MYCILMYAQLAAGISGTILIRVPRVPAVDSLLPPGATAEHKKGNIPKELLLSSHVSRTAAAISNLLSHGNAAPACPQPRVLNPSEA